MEESLASEIYEAQSMNAGRLAHFATTLEQLMMGQRYKVLLTSAQHPGKFMYDLAKRMRFNSPSLRVSSLKR